MPAQRLTPLPWQARQWETISNAYHAGCLAHAILLSGPPGIGLGYFIECLVAGLLCEFADERLQPCLNCRSCRLYQAKTHPDYYLIDVEHPGQQIKIDEVRSLIEFIRLKSQYRHYKICSIGAADNMNRSTANALLKTLEEPPPQSLLILSSHNPKALPATIRSRCQQIKFSAAFDDDTLRWVKANIKTGEDPKYLLKMAGGAPLAIKPMVEQNILAQQRQILADLLTIDENQGDPVVLAGQWNAYGVSQVLSYLSMLLVDVVRIKLFVQPLRMNDPEIINRLQVLIKQLDLKDILFFHKILLEKYRENISLTSYNAQGLLENIVISWQQLISKR